MKRRNLIRSMLLTPLACAVPGLVSGQAEEELPSTEDELVRLEWNPYKCTQARVGSYMITTRSLTPDRFIQVGEHRPGSVVLYMFDSNGAPATGSGIVEIRSICPDGVTHLETLEAHFLEKPAMLEVGLFRKTPGGAISGGRNVDKQPENGAKQQERAQKALRSSW